MKIRHPSPPVSEAGASICTDCTTRSQCLGTNLADLPALPMSVEPGIVEKDDLLYVQGEPANDLYVIRRGTVKLTNEPTDDAPPLQRICVSPEMIGTEALNAGSYGATARALRRTWICRLSPKRQAGASEDRSASTSTSEA